MRKVDPRNAVPHRRNWKKTAALIAGVGLAVLLGGLGAATLAIGAGVRRLSDKARQAYAGDRVTALIALVECESCSLKDRNHAVWALGQLADRRAVPLLHKYYTGQKCDHLHALCQNELRKALKLAEAGSNPSAFLWRWMLPAKS